MCVVLVIVNLSFFLLGRRVVELVSQQQTDEQKEQIEEEEEDDDEEGEQVSRKQIVEVRHTSSMVEMCSFGTLSGTPKKAAHNIVRYSSESCSYPAIPD